MATFGYVLRDLYPELKRQDGDTHCIEERRTYPKRIEQIFGTVNFGAREILNNSFVLLSATSRATRRFSVVKVLLVFHMIKADLASADEAAFIRYM